MFVSRNLDETIRNHEGKKKRTRSDDTKGTPVNTAEQQLGYQGTQSSVESITI